ncbi:MAG TPA: hypothetical protein VFO82_08500 [Steroidobacteraceae bacterium]|nr:hypothetical protein [Steroidobacteraceae bacterium]
MRVSAHSRLWFAAILLSACMRVAAAPGDTDESAYAPSTLARILGGTARSQNDEAELAGMADWYTTTANFTGRKRPPSGRFRPIIGAWVSSRGLDPSTTDLHFSGELPELEFEQGGRKYWVMAGLPGGLGFDVYPPGQKLTIYLQKVGFASGTPVAVLTMAKLPAGVTSTTVTKGPVMRNTRMGEGARRQEGTYQAGTATFTYAGREYSLPLDASGRHSITPGMYSYENGVRTALLEYGSSDTQYLLLRVPVNEAGESRSDIVPYLVLNGRIVPPIDLAACEMNVEELSRSAARGSVDCSAVGRAVFSKLRFTAD